MFRWSFAGYFFFGYCCVAVLGASPLISSVCCRARQSALSSLCLATHGRTTSRCCCTVSTFGRASPVPPRSSTCCRAPWCRARQNARALASAAALHGAARGRTLLSSPVLPRTPWCRARCSTPHRRQRAGAQFLRSAAHRLCRRAVQRAAALHGAARGRTPVSSPVLPPSMVPRARQYASSSSTCCRTVSTFGRASPVLPRSSTCCRTLHGAARAAVRLIVVNVLPHSFYVRPRIACAAAQFNVLPRSMVPRARQYASSSSMCCRAVSTFGCASPVLPRSSTCCRAPLGAARAAVRLIVFACAAAQSNVLPRSMVPRAAERLCLPPCFRAVQRAAALHGAARGRTPVSSPVQPHSHTAALLGAAHLYAAARPWCRACGQMVSSSVCCRVPWCRAVLHVAAFHAAALR